VVERDEIVKGYEVDKGEWVYVTDKELKQLQPPSSQSMEILQMVKLSEVDPLYFETSYFSVPEEAGRRAYSLLLETMEQLKLGAIAKITLHQRERTVVIRPYEDGLTLHSIYYPNEIHEVAEYGEDVAKDLKAKEIDLAAQFAKGLVKPFHPQDFRDEYQVRVKKLIESKSKNLPAPKPEKPKRLAPVINLMDALKQSMAKKGGAASARQTSATKSREKAPAHRQRKAS
jgi:DNA end-binding protein Ku